jgi:hypothetical protein
VAKTKGTNLIPAVKFLRKRRAQALAALPPALHHYLEERVLPTSWYPEADLAALLRAMAPLMADAGGDPFELMGRATVREHMAGVYEHLLRGDRTSLSRRVTALWQTMHDTGSLRLVDQAPGCARYELRDYAHPTREMCGTIRGYIGESLVQSGFASARVVETACVVDGAECCVFECKWSEP